MQEDNPTTSEIDITLYSQKIAREILKQLENNNIHIPPDQIKHELSVLETTVEELVDRGVEIGEVIESKYSARRVVYKGKFQGQEVVIKFAPTESLQDSNVREYKIYQKAIEDNRAGEFAKTYLITEDNRAVVQEFCTGFIVLSDYMKPRDRWFTENEETEAEAINWDRMTVDHTKLSGRPLDSIIKYKIREVQMGQNKEGKWVYVDYGT